MRIGGSAIRMTDRQRVRPIVVVLDPSVQQSRLRTRLEQATDRDVRTVPAPDEPASLRDSMATPLDPDDGRAASPSTHGTEPDPTSTGETEPTDETAPVTPSAVVLELDRPSDVQALLGRLHTDLPDVPTIVAPHEGSERLATVALRADATDYVPTDGDADPVDRIVSTSQSKPRVRSDDGDSRCQHGLATELPDDAFVIDADGTYLEATVRSEAAELYSVPADELPGTALEDAFPETVAASLQDGIERAIQTDTVQSIEYEVDTTDGCRQFEARIVSIDERIHGRRAAVLLARDITDRVERERQLRSRQAHLETGHRINTVVRQVIETLVEAPTRDTIERDVCDQLVDSELYCGSVIAERIGDGRVASRTSAGDLEAVSDCVHEWAADQEHPIVQAAQTGELRTTDCDREDESIPDELHETASDDVKASLVVPLTHEDVTYGVLTVLANRDDAFGEHERAGFRLLGETIGFTIMAVKNRQLLFADSVVELEFRVDGGETFCFDLTETYDCRCSLEWTGTTASGRRFQYVTVEGMNGTEVLEAARAHDSVEGCRLIHDGEGRCTIELRLSTSSVRTLANHGATIRDVSIADGVGTCLVEASQNANVRELVEALTVACENADLVARREVDREVKTATERRTRILDKLTDRQLTTLRIAYYGGFFEWPRESTGEDIADAMDISPPTMHQHLRKGLNSILGEFFETHGESKRQ